jgi:hypothetical protein
MQEHNRIFWQAQARDFGGKSHIRCHKFSVRRKRGRQIDAVVNRFGKIERNDECSVQQQERRKNSYCRLDLLKRALPLFCFRPLQLSPTHLGQQRVAAFDKQEIGRGNIMVCMVRSTSFPKNSSKERRCARGLSNRDASIASGISMTAQAATSFILTCSIAPKPS